MRHSTPTRHRTSPAFRSLRLVLVGVLVAVGLVGVLNVSRAPDSEAVDMSQFRPGNIISDAVFFDTGTMSVAQIQSFLDAQGSRCTDAYCLKHINLISVNKAADAYCNGYASPGYEKAATIIWKVAQSCGVNPQVILVMLQKEQGLVTTTAPTDGKYRAAMGMGCPDTSACDAQYYGFGNQVYAGIRQMRVYELSGRYTWNNPGTSPTIRYHPNAACGGTPVYIENQATANLYYYTPYQPNAASIAAGAGTGDSCSSYGNRNFYRYFSDWFGSTQGGAVRLIRTAADPTVYLIDGLRRWSVASLDDYNELIQVFGPLNTVSASFVNRYAAAGATSTILHDTGSGAISLVQDGTLHRFASCDQVAIWGGSCASLTSAHPAMFAGTTAGPEMSSWARVGAGARPVLLSSSGAAQPYWDAEAVRALTGSPLGWTARMGDARYAAFTKAPTLFAPATLVRDAASPQVYLTDGTNTLLPVADFAATTELGRASSTLQTVTAADLTGYRPAGTKVETAVTCGGSTYVAGTGTLHRLANPAAAGLPTVALQPQTCAQLALGGRAVASGLLVKKAGDATVYSVEQGVRRAVLSWSDAQRIGGEGDPTIVTMTADGLARIPAGGARLRDASLVKPSSSPEVLVVSGDKLARIPSFAMAAQWGIPSSFATVSTADLGTRTRVADLSLWGRCGTDLVAAASGKVSRVTGADAAQGFAVQEWTTEACATFDRTGPTVPRLFVKASNDATVLAAEGGTYRPVTSWDALVRLNGGGTPVVLTVDPGVASGLPRGAAVS
ncbi:hypothetical protein [Aeromicrobium sp. Leaf350]|uniref:hypothetical protein n=1 Tax=Aeromicrobium sp. Leaf350 TaxID=2876565 RepID=UPI001E32A546|nr:hypothetical protein [Aeromicrobium sp. Leaf350]